MALTAHHPASLTGNDQYLIAYTLVIAAALHLFILLTIAFVPSQTKQPVIHQQELKVVLVPKPTQEIDKPEDSQLLAQANTLGGGQIEHENPQAQPALQPAPDPKPAIESAPPPALPPPMPLPAPTAVEPQLPEPPPLKAEPAPPPEPTPEPMIKAIRPPKPAPVSKPEPRKPREEPKTRPAQTRPETPKPRISAAQLLASRSNEIARLTSELERKSAAYASRTKRKAISASTTEYKYATYMEAWRRKVERIGNLNYPDEARRKKLYGDLLLHVAIRSDGSLERIRVLKSSGHKLLDDAAVRIVRMGAPYAPFPPNIRKEVDVLDITRTWQFLNNNRLGWK